MLARTFGTFALFWSLAAMIACAGGKSLDIVPGDGDYSGSIVVTTVATDPSTGPGVASLFDPSGKLVKIIQDYYAYSEFPTGSAFVPPDQVLISVDGADRLELWSLSKSALLYPVTHAGLSSSPLRQIARDPIDGSIYVAEASANTVEKFTLNPNGGYARAGNPFIAANVGGCSLATPWSIAVIPDSQQVAVLSSPSGGSGRLSIYDKDGNCVRHLTTAPISANAPQGLAYHRPSGKLILGFVTNHSLYSIDLDGTGATLIFQNSTIINAPRSIAADKDGFLYVTSSGTDTIEKLSYSGTGTASRATAGPLIGPGITSQNPTSVMVIE